MRMTASDISAGRAAELLTELVRTDSINPMGRPYNGSKPVERAVLDVIEDWLTPYQHRLSLTRQSCSPIHESLIIRLEGETAAPAALFESHADTVPADEWADRALEPHVEGGRLVGRGACDDKGSLAGMLLALADLVEQGVTPPRPVVLVCAGDEEFAQTGIRHFVDETDEEFAYGIFGEPTSLHPIVQHKGTVRWDISVHGVSAHTACPELGRNAVLGMVDLVTALGQYQETLQQQWTSGLMTGPLLTPTIVRGGRTRNATPDQCTISIDFRILPGMQAEQEKQALAEFLDATLDWEVTHSDNQLVTPALNTDPDSAFCRRLLATCRRAAGDRLELKGAPYGTDAAWVSDQCPAIVLGPGDIAFAHAIDEQIAIDEVAESARVYREIMSEPFELD